MGSRLAGKVAVVVGSTSGIGRATAELFASEGASVVVSGRRAALGRSVVERISSDGGNAAYMQTDINMSEQIRALIAFTMATYGRLDVLVNNAWSGRQKALLDTSEEDWDDAMVGSLRAVFLACKCAIPEMIKNGGGSIISTSSVHGILAGPGSSSYESAKAGIIHLMRQIVVDYGRLGIRANTVCPGYTIVEAHEPYLKDHPEALSFWAKVTPLGRPGNTMDVARAALFLASDESAFIAGQALVVDGGMTCQLQDSAARALAGSVI